MTKEERQKTKNNFLSILKVFDGNLQKTCKAIDVSRPTVYAWLKSDENFKNKYDKIKDYYKIARLPMATSHVCSAAGVAH